MYAEAEVKFHAFLLSTLNRGKFHASDQRTHRYPLRRRVNEQQGCSGRIPPPSIEVWLFSLATVLTELPRLPEDPQI